MVKLSAIQLTSTPDIEANLAVIDGLLTRLEPTVEHLVVLPECCLCFGGNDQTIFQLAQKNQLTNSLTSSLSGLAKKHQVTLVAGTIPELSRSGQKYRNTSFVFSPNGEVLGHYDKIHLFDANVDDRLDDGQAHYLESSFTQAGEQVSMVDIGFAKLGLSVCYDLRFPEIFLHYVLNESVDLFLVPAAFTTKTGKTHWKSLLVARAIECQAFVLAAAQVGYHRDLKKEKLRKSWGQSLAIGPWGKILQETESFEAFLDSCLTDHPPINSVLDQEDIRSYRSSIPVNQHRRYTVELKEK